MAEQDYKQEGDPESPVGFARQLKGLMTAIEQIQQQVKELNDIQKFPIEFAIELGILWSETIWKLNWQEYADAGISQSTLAKLRMSSHEAKFLKLGRHVVYRCEDLDARLAANTHTSTSDDGSEV